MSIISVIGLVGIGINITISIYRKNYDASIGWIAALCFDTAFITK